MQHTHPTTVATTASARPRSRAFTTPRPTSDAPDAPVVTYRLYAPDGHFTRDDESRMRRLMTERLLYRTDLYRDDNDPVTGQPDAVRLATAFAFDMHDFWMGVAEVWPSQARLLDHRRHPFGQVIDAARDAISAFFMGAQLVNVSTDDDDDADSADVSETDVSDIDLITLGLEAFIS